MIDHWSVFSSFGHALISWLHAVGWSSADVIVWVISSWCKSILLGQLWLLRTQAWRRVWKRLILISTYLCSGLFSLIVCILFEFLWIPAKLLLTFLIKVYWSITRMDRRWYPIHSRIQVLPCVKVIKVGSSCFNLNYDYFF